jgi:hypothetical protein
MKYAVEMRSDAMMTIPTFIMIGLVILKFMEEGVHVDYISLLLFLSKYGE